MNLDKFLISASESVRRKGPNDRIVMSSRVRLARNIKDGAFPGWAKKPERVRVMEIIRPAVESLPEMKGAFSETMDNITTLDKQILVERHLVSREHAAKSLGSGLVINTDETLAVMINEEDHLRMQALRPGLQIRQAWQALDRLDSELERKLDYAFSNDLGYLTACPTNLGTGIRVSVLDGEGVEGFTRDGPVSCAMFAYGPESDEDDRVLEQRNVSGLVTEFLRLVQEMREHGKAI